METKNKITVTFLQSFISEIWWIKSSIPDILNFLFTNIRNFKFYQNYLTLGSHTNTVFGGMFAPEGVPKGAPEGAPVGARARRG